jgi:hypothetical protein
VSGSPFPNGGLQRACEHTLWTSHICKTCTHSILQKCQKFKKHFVVCTKSKLSEINCFFEWGFSPSKCKKEKTCLRTSTWLRHLWINYIPLKWRLKMKTCTWYFLWAFSYLLIIWSRVLNPCSLRMLMFNSLVLDCIMRFPKENKMKVWKMLHCLTKLIR